MRVQASPPLHLTYCLNVHPGESWPEQFTAVRQDALRVRDHIAPGKPFGLGLRLGSQAAREISEPKMLQEFREFLTRENLYVFTINGFPYGQFHDTAVKHGVYRPDWTTPQRRDYTIALADILAELLCEGVAGSISTVPCSYKGWISSDEDVGKLVHMLTDVAAHLADIRDRTGKDICLCLEPEPDCHIASTAETIAFFQGPLASFGTRYLQERGPSNASRAVDVLSRHVGVCLDTAHVAVEFENLTASLNQLRNAGIRIGKVQLSSALRVRPTPDALHELRAFCDRVYLHQVKIRSPTGQIISYPDLPDALAAAEPTADPKNEWRVHFHLPLFFTSHGNLQSTSSLFTPEFVNAITAGATEHVEIETYTFSVLPEMLRPADIAEGITKEYQWVLQHLFPNASRGV